MLEGQSPVPLAHAIACCKGRKIGYKNYVSSVVCHRAGNDRGRMVRKTYDRLSFRNINVSKKYRWANFLMIVRDAFSLSYVTNVELPNI